MIAAGVPKRTFQPPSELFQQSLRWAFLYSGETTWYFENREPRAQRHDALPKERQRLCQCSEKIEEVQIKEKDLWCLPHLRRAIRIGKHVYPGSPSDGYFGRRDWPKPKKRFLGMIELPR
jgi:hypothetical protein